MKIYEELRKRYEGIEEYSMESGDWEDAGVEAYKAGNYLKAVEEFQRVIVSIPDHYNAYEMCSYALYKSGERKKAVGYLEEGLEIAKSYHCESEILEEVLEEVVEDMERSLKGMKKGEELDTEYIEEIME
ncbi:hypothetical protein PM10SUCC1_19580 [Propionigenium maris DSM 9537]|uniref:Tetratricopeptide repeat protein n=1 Tax=Propionigenium maris DSM 9537 TaxID=1123000 RepID=A0A9W6GMB0_9FUSO|nr:hypothetical protein [Propionigenium maris]GLI56444.1 hypothetical protein PM10SUCC1_19580 [Propionigenium maris DSM 9537]